MSSFGEQSAHEKTPGHSVVMPNRTDLWKIDATTYTNQSQFIIVIAKVPLPFIKSACLTVESPRV